MVRVRRPSLAQVHIWLGWIIGVPLLFWTVSGLWMAARPIDEVRGIPLRAGAAPLSITRPVVLPVLHAGHGVLRSMRLEQQTNGPVWIAVFDHGHEMRASAYDGQWMPAVTEREARQIADRWYLPQSSIQSAIVTPASAPPLDLRRERPAWGVTFADGNRVYIDADTGSFLAIRSTQWRWFDWMWGLHIMDLQGRENSSHAILIGAAILAVITVIVGLILLPRHKNRKNI